MITIVCRLVLFCAYLSLFIAAQLMAQENRFVQGLIEFQKTEAKIHYADSIRTANRSLFNRLVAELAAKQDTLTVKQMLYLTYFMGYQKAIVGEIKAAITLLDKVIEQDEYQFVKYRAIITKVTIHSTSKNYTQGFLVLNNLLPELKVLEDKVIYPEALFAVASFYNRLSIYHLSQRYTRQLLATKPSPRYICLSNMLNVESMFFLKELTMDKIDNAWVAQCEAIGENMAASFIHVITAKFYLNENKPALALELLLKHLESVKSTQYYLLISKFHSFIAQAYYALENFTLAERYALMVIDNVAENHSSLSIVRASNILYQLNKEKNDLSKALAYHELYTLHDKLYNDDLNKRSFTYQIAEDNNREKNNQLIILFEQNKNLKLERILHERTREKDQLLILSLMLIVAILAYWTYKSKLTQRKLKKMAEYDELTGILNRRCFNELADTAIKYCRQSGQPISLILFDLDEFKAINDTYGHQVGDWVLKNTIMTCQKLCRKNDIFGRFGGEEFTILLPGCDNDKALELAESCRAVISEISTLETGYDFKISASFGICSSEHGSYSLNEIVKAADEAMYHAKSSGRNRVSIYGIDMPNTVEDSCLSEEVTTLE